ncbi:MAG: D-glycero-alpha-D-manno-heptose-1,7-bisphosphate 7-phosphatase [Nitrospinota bacterium]
MGSISRAVFLDRDGVINRKAPDGEYIKSWEEFEFLNGAPEAVALLKQNGFLVILVTNQRGISLGKVREEDVREIHRRMQRQLWDVGAKMDAVYYCPHDYGQCSCRKPDVGMFLQAKRDFPTIDFTKSFVIGDSKVDMEAAARLNCGKILIADKDSSLLQELAEMGVEIGFTSFCLREAVADFILSTSSQ